MTQRFVLRFIDNNKDVLRGNNKQVLQSAGKHAALWNVLQSEEIMKNRIRKDSDESADYDHL